MRYVLAVVAGGAVLLASTTASAQQVRHFGNCTDMHTVYRGGVALPHARDHRTGGGHARYAPHRSTALYRANSSMDRDHDGIACEQ